MDSQPGKGARNLILSAEFHFQPVLPSVILPRKLASSSVTRHTDGNNCSSDELSDFGSRRDIFTFPFNERILREVIRFDNILENLEVVSIDEIDLYGNFEYYMLYFILITNRIMK